MFKIIKLELLRIFKSKRILYYLVCMFSLVTTNIILEKSLDTNPSINAQLFNIFQTFNMFYFLICSFTLSTNISNDYEKNYISCYKLLKVSEEKLIFAKIIVNLLISILSVVAFFVVWGLIIGVSISILGQILFILILTTTLTIIIQSIVSIICKKNITTISWCFGLWFLLTILNTIPCFFGMLGYFDNNGLVDLLVTNYLDIPWTSLLNINNVPFTSLSGLNMYLIVYNIVVICICYMAIKKVSKR